MQHTDLVDKAKKLLFFNNEEENGLLKTMLMLGLNRTIGRVCFTQLDAKEKYSWRISQDTMVSLAKKVREISSSKEELVARMNSANINKEGAASEFHTITSQGGRHALESFVENFYPKAKEMLHATLTTNGFNKLQADHVMQEVASIDLEVAFARINSQPSYIFEIIPVFSNDAHSGDVWGSRLTHAIPLTHDMPGMKGMNPADANYMLFRMIALSERIDAVADEKEKAEPFQFDKQILQEWNSKNTPWFLKTEKYILTFYSYFAVAYLTQTETESLSNHVVLGDFTKDKQGGRSVVV